MQGARAVAERIRSVGNIGKVCRAMEAVSATKMRRAEEAQAASRAFAAQAAQLMALLGAQPAAGVLHPLLSRHDHGRPAMVLVTPDRGLTGGLGRALIVYAMERARELGSDVAWIAIGRRGAQFLARHPDPVLVASFDRIADVPTRDDWVPPLEVIRDDFLLGDFQSVHVVYPPYRSPDGARVGMMKLLPIELEPDRRLSASSLTFEPNADEVFEEVLERLLEWRVYQAIVEAKASEHLARMVAMRNAAAATDDIVSSLTLTYNKWRQADITAELLDITGGAEALRQDPSAGAR